MKQEAATLLRSRLILDAARKCFAQHGFHGASMARIAGVAGISVGHIYRYFENKEAVVAAIVEEALEQAASRIAADGGDPGAVAGYVRSQLKEPPDTHGTAMRLEILSEAARNPKIATMMAAADQRKRGEVAAALSRGREQGGLPPDPPALAQAREELLSALFEGLRIQRFRRPNAPLEQTLGPAVEQLIVWLLTVRLATPASETEDAEGRLNA